LVLLKETEEIEAFISSTKLPENLEILRGLKTEMVDIENLKFCWVLVVHACNPSYSGGRDQEDPGLKPV
jgi:hypothetical protein